MLDALGPAQIAHVNQPVNSVLDLDEGAKVGEVAHASFNCRADGIFLVQPLPRIRLQLLQAERNPALVGIHIENHALDLIADVHQLGGMFHALGPGHLTHVDQAFNALLQLDEGAVVGDAKHAALDARANGIALCGVEPRVRRKLLEAKRYAQLVGIELQNFYLDLIAHVHQVTRMSQASPRHISDVEQTVNAAQVDESAV